jgi:hypothetical protein
MSGNIGAHSAYYFTHAYNFWEPGFSLFLTYGSCIYEIISISITNFKPNQSPANQYHQVKTLEYSINLDI